MGWVAQRCYSSTWKGSRMPAGCLKGEMTCRSERRSEGRPRRDYISHLAWKSLGVPPAELEEVAGQRKAWASQTQISISDGWMEGWKEGWMAKSVKSNTNSPVNVKKLHYCEIHGSMWQSAFKLFCKATCLQYLWWLFFQIIQTPWECTHFW